MAGRGLPALSDRKRPLTSPQPSVKLVSLGGAMYPGFEGGISPSESTFPYLNLALKWSNEPGPPHRNTKVIE